MFDLPVKTRRERKAASKFRSDLQDQGFEMCQFSVYLRFCGSKRQVEALTGKVGQMAPNHGSVYILCFTDKQYENIVAFEGGRQQDKWENPGQYALF